MPRKKKSNNWNYVNLPDFALDDRAKRSIIILVLLLLGLVSLLGLFNAAGHFGVFLTRWLTLIFGFGKWLVPLIFLYWALIIIRRLKKPLKFSDYLGLFLLFLSYQALFHFFIKPANWLIAVKAGHGGGYVGLYLSKFFVYVFGFWGGTVVLIVLLLISLVLVFNTSLSRLIGRESLWARIFRPFGIFFRNLFTGAEDGEGEAERGREFAAEAREEILDRWQKRDLDLAEAEMEAEEKIIAKGKRPKVQEKIVWPKRLVKIDLPLELLNNKFSQAVGGDTEANAQKIKNTLEKFGIEVEMGETRVGPTVTQYTFRPAEGVKLSRITTLNNDLSLALAAHPIRIEAPIPGKSLVGVEVPNKTKAIVGLREILTDPAFKARKNNLFIALGKDVSGTVWLYDLNRMPHLLVAGATNSGKSVCLNAIIVSLLYQNSPDDLRFVMIDPKRVELPVYNGIPHLLTPVITDVNKTINALKWCLNEMDRRYDVLNKSGKKNIQSYNASSRGKMPYIVFIIDELADFMMTSGKEMEAAVIRLAQMSRAIGIHLILATQRPSVDVITGLIKANIPTRIAFSVASLVDSKTILDMSGAEKLLGQGDMLFMTPELSKPKRIQGAFLSETEINDIVNYIKEKSGGAEYLEGVTDRQKVSGNAGVGLDGTHGDEDELFEEAKDIIIRAGKASTSMLQRRLSIGYGRAAKILDMLEEAGIIGPVNGARPREVLISREQYEAEASGVSGQPLHSRRDSRPPESYFGDEDEEEEAEEGDDGILDFSAREEENGDEGGDGNEEGEEREEEGEGEKSADEKVEEELGLSPEEENEAIEDEDEILEEIRDEKEADDFPAGRREDDKRRDDKKKAAPTKSSASDRHPAAFVDDDEMFFSK